MKNNELNILSNVDNRTKALLGNELLDFLSDIKTYYSAFKTETIIKIKSLIERGADVNVATNSGVTPLMVAVTKYPLVVVDMLLKANANPNAKNDGADTALILASIRGDNKAAELLVKAGANPSLKNNEGKSAFDYADKAVRKALGKYIPNKEFSM